MQVFLVPEADFALNRLDYLGSYMQRNSKQGGSKHHNPKQLPAALIKSSLLSPALSASIYQDIHSWS